MDKQQYREIEKREGIVRGPGVPPADAPSDRPEEDVPHPAQLNEFHGHGKAKDRSRRVGPTGSTPR